MLSVFLVVIAVMLTVILGASPAPSALQRDYQTAWGIGMDPHKRSAPSG